MTSDYGGHQISTNVMSNENNTSPKNTEVPTSSYATIAQKLTFPSKDQAIVMDSLENVPLNDYIVAIGKLVTPANIRFASKISMNRVCIYLTNKELVKTITEKNTRVNIGNCMVGIRPLLTRYTRIILSNVCPVIPHLTLENELKKLNIRLASSITFLRAGIAEPGYAHILSFRRQVYVHPDDISKVPASIKISFDETTYWIYLSSDDIACFICKQKGHLAKNCETNVSKPVQPDTNDAQTSVCDGRTTIDDFPDLKAPSAAKTKDDSMEIGLFPELMVPGVAKSNDYTPQPIVSALPSNNTKPQKRPLSTTTSSIDDSSITNSSTSDVNKTVKIKHRIQVKKPKSDNTGLNNSDKMEDLLSPLKTKLSGEENPYVLNYAQFKGFIERTKGNPNIKDLSLEYTDDTQSLITMLRENYLNLTDRNIKNRFTRIINKLSTNFSKEIISDTSSITDGDGEGEFLDNVSV